MTTPSATRITDWDNPGLPLLLRLFNAVAGWPTRTFVSLEPEDLLSAASKQTALSDFGDDRFREPLEILLRAVQSETELSTFGRIALRQFMLQLLRSRLRLEELYRLHPEIEDEQIERPIIDCGLPRTGTTHLLKLLT
ncbi:MAG: sulfotransferase, partial [Deltaproteobacteria bacterium]|nr:sulfotransferase [Deltaproteobacteria bacterium]